MSKVTRSRNRSSESISRRTGRSDKLKPDLFAPCRIASKASLICIPSASPRPKTDPPGLPIQSEVLPKHRRREEHEAPPSRSRHRQNQTIRCLNAVAEKVEMLFAHLKRILGLGRLRLRGPNGAKDEFLRAASKDQLTALATSSFPQNQWYADLRCKVLRSLQCG